MVVPHQLGTIWLPQKNELYIVADELKSIAKLSRLHKGFDKHGGVGSRILIKNMY